MPIHEIVQKYDHFSTVRFMAGDQLITFQRRGYDADLPKFVFYWLSGTGQVIQRSSSDEPDFTLSQPIRSA